MVNLMELSDWVVGKVLWIVLIMKLIEVLHENYVKLTDRKKRGVIKGDGDRR